MAAQFSDNDSIESTITYQEVESDHIHIPHLFDYAIQYVRSVKNTFGANSQEYLHFLAMLNDHTAERISKQVVVSRVKIIFSHHQELIEGFNKFLPDENQIALPITRRRDPSLQETVSYNNKVEAAFSEENERYLSFVQLNVDYQDAEISLLQLIEQMCQLLSDRQDLLEEFFDYIPSRRQ